MDEEVLVVLMTAPSQEVAMNLAGRLVAEGWAACVNVLPAVTSVYTWKGEQQRESEVLLLAKTTASKFRNGFCEAVIAMHPYEVPEVIALPVTGGWPPYLEWVEGSVGK